MLICTLVGGCSGATHVAATPATGTSSSVPDKASIQRLDLPKLKLGPNGNVNPHRFTPVEVPYVGYSSHRRSTKATVHTANEQQITGITFSGSDAQGAQTNDLNFLGAVSNSTQLPNPASGANYLISPDTVVGSDSCIELKTVFFRNAGDATTTREMHVFDSCTRTEFRIATIDANFMTTYTHDYGFGVGPQYFADVKKVGATWQVFLNNFVTNAFDSYYTAPGTAPAPAGGQSTFNVNTFAIGNCPVLGGGSQEAEAFQIATANGTSPPVWATMAPTSSAGGTPDCFDSGASTWSAYYYVVFGNGTPGYVKWEVFTSTGAPSPSPTPTAIPTATPTPTPTPTATPTPGPRIFTVTQNISTLNVKIGTASTVFKCFVSIRSYDSIEVSHRVEDGTMSTGPGAGAFPVMASPTTSYVSWAVPDFGPTYTVLANTSNPTQTLYQVMQGHDETHCVDLSINTPSTIRAGTYPGNINYAGYARMSPTGGLYANFGHQDVVFNVVASP